MKAESAQVLLFCVYDVAKWTLRRTLADPVVHLVLLKSSTVKAFTTFCQSPLQAPFFSEMKRWNVRQMSDVYVVVVTHSLAVWPDLAKFHHLSKSLQVFGSFLMVYLLFGIMLSRLLQICDIIGLIFSVANGQILKNNLTIWSHCPFA